MSQQDNFGSGFLLGTLFGGILGGVVGAVVTARVLREDSSSSEAEALPRPRHSDDDAIDALPPNEAEMEVARRGLEEKIAQLNTAIDDVRQRLGGVNGHSQAAESSTHREH